ncbi:MAG: efflux RND transporter periplasmic adaptor subunit [Calditrichaeota bacterium]|nr:efflux RND transporter periplasmic adaptor subunit [Calditrichota bacterium]
MKRTFLTFKFNRITLLMLGLFIFGCGGEDDKRTEVEHNSNEHNDEIVLSAEIAREVGIEVGTPQRTTIRQSFTAQGKVVVNPDFVAHLNSLVPGRLRKIYVQIGDYVKKGQPLFELESLEIANITADYMRANAEYGAQKANYERIKKLRAQDIKAEKDLIDAKASFERAEAELKAAANRKLRLIGFSEEDVKTMFNGDEHRRGILTVKSPINGYVTERNIELGQMIQPETDVMKVIDNTRIWVEAEVYEKDYANLKIGQEATITATALPDEKFSGQVIKINKELDPQSRTFTVFVKINQGKTELIPNMFTTIEFHYGSPDTIIAVPDEAVQFDGTDYFVFVAIKPNKYLKRNIVIGDRSNSLIQVKQGLDSGEAIVVRNAFFVKSEMEKESFGEGHGH